MPSTYHTEDNLANITKTLPYQTVQARVAELVMARWRVQSQKISESRHETMESCNHYSKESNDSQDFYPFRSQLFVFLHQSM